MLYHPGIYSSLSRNTFIRVRTPWIHLEDTEPAYFLQNVLYVYLGITESIVLQEIGCRCDCYVYISIFWVNVSSLIYIDIATSDYIEWLPLHFSSFLCDFQYYSHRWFIIITNSKNPINPTWLLAPSYLPHDFPLRHFEILHRQLPTSETRPLFRVPTALSLLKRFCLPTATERLVSCAISALATIYAFIAFNEIIYAATFM